MSRRGVVPRRRPSMNTYAHGSTLTVRKPGLLRAFGGATIGTAGISAVGLDDGARVTSGAGLVSVFGESRILDRSFARSANDSPTTLTPIPARTSSGSRMRGRCDARGDSFVFRNGADETASEFDGSVTLRAPGGADSPELFRCAN